MFIGQIHAAGVGVNLTASRIVVFNDLDWVPAHHWQAEDRAHRIGQDRTVNVTYMVARGTIEEFVRSVLETKTQLIDGVVEGKSLSEGMDADVLTELKRMIAHLGGTLEMARLQQADPKSFEGLLRAASDRYLKANAERMSAAARRELKPISQSAIKALALVLAGPDVTVYSIVSAADPNVSYRLEVEGADITCDCAGFSYRGMCRHVRDLRKAIASGEAIPAQYVRGESSG